MSACLLFFRFSNCCSMMRQARVPSWPRARADEQALAQVARPHPRRLERLDEGEHAQDVLDRGTGELGQLLDRGGQVAAVVERADDDLAERQVVVGQGQQVELVGQVLGQALAADRDLLEELGVRLALRDRGAVEVVLHEVRPVDLVLDLGNLLVSGPADSCSSRSSGFSSPSVFWSSTSANSSTSSRNGLRTSSSLMICWSSKVGTWRSFRACCSCGVMTIRCCCAWCRPCFSSMAILRRGRHATARTVRPDRICGLGTGHQEGGASFDEDPALVHDGGAVGDAQRLPHVVVGDQHAESLLLQPLDDVLDLRDRDRVDADERLVEEEEARPGGQRPRDLDAPPLAARELGPRAIGQRGQVQLLEQPLEAFLPFRAGELHGLEHGQHVVLHRQLAEDARLLGQVADPRRALR